MKERLVLSNRINQKIVGVVNQPEGSKGLAVVMHGLGGTKEDPIVTSIAQSFLSQGITVVRFDTTNTFGESDGNYADATTTNFVHDLEDVIEQLKDTPWYTYPFYLAGHSLGGLAVTVFSERNPKLVKGLGQAAPVISGQLTEAVRGSDYIRTWEERGFRQEDDPIHPGLKWQHMLDRRKYDLLQFANRLTMPVLLVIGENDTHIPVAHQKILYSKLPSPKAIYIIPNASHELDSDSARKDIYTIFSSWINAVESE
ncbi:MAG TPA: alpha/beta fold hydrolase [Candidatus Sulfotelmatobacter sp.]|jgi:pimeloyl-ACP methyl ester carboxylesterase|nr:alpha/beta fold hydrolase [Candidatus Sulfotelmatobacter sp.]